MIGTKNVTTAGKGSKTIEPGNVTCKITGVALKPFTLTAGGYEVILNLETKPMGEGFEGFFINPADQSQGRHLGQVGKVKLSQWAYKDGETKTHVPISRDVEMLKDLKRLCEGLGPVALKWFDDEDNKHSTIESLFEAFNNSQPFKDTYMDFCICGKEYLNKQQYKAYELFLPKFTKVSNPYELENTKASKLAIFNVVEHIIPMKDAPVSNFNSGDDTGAPGTAAPADNSFEL